MLELQTAFAWIVGVKMKWVNSAVSNKMQCKSDSKMLEAHCEKPEKGLRFGDCSDTTKNQPSLWCHKQVT